jgi:hypothetical protein
MLHDKFSASKPEEELPCWLFSTVSLALLVPARRKIAKMIGKMDRIIRVILFLFVFWSQQI